MNNYKSIIDFLKDIARNLEIKVDVVHSKNITEIDFEQDYVVWIPPLANDFSIGEPTTFNPVWKANILFAKVSDTDTDEAENIQI